MLTFLRRRYRLRVSRRRHADLQDILARILEQHPSTRTAVCQWWQTIHGSDIDRDQMKVLLLKLADSIQQKYFFFVGLYNVPEDAFAHVMWFINELNAVTTSCTRILLTDRPVTEPIDLRDTDIQEWLSSDLIVEWCPYSGLIGKVCERLGQLRS
jgi:hypothetical protein